MKWLVIAAIWSALMGSLVPRAGANNLANRIAQGETDQDNSLIANARQASTTCKEQATAYERPHWYKSPEWILVIVGIITALVVGWQSWETRKAVTASLRATLVIRGIEFIPDTKVPVLGTKPSPWHIRIAVANTGGNKASVIESTLTFVREDAFSDGTRIVLPTFPPYGREALSLGRFTLDAGEYVAKVVPLSDEMSLNFRIREVAKRGGGAGPLYRMFCFGFLQYRDALRIEHRSGFAFRYDADSERFERVDNPEYNYAD